MKWYKNLVFGLSCLLLLQLVLPDNQRLLAQSKADSLKANPLFELSFGQNLLFLSKSRQTTILNSLDLVVPTSAVLFFAVFRPEKKWKLPVFFNLPTESTQFLQPNGTIRYQRSTPSFGSGIEFRLLKFDIREKIKFDMEAGPLLAFVTDFRNEFVPAPLITTRMRLRSDDNFVMYLGGSYTIGLDAFGLFYGTGFNF
jgi:hypothetical protein